MMKKKLILITLLVSALTSMYGQILYDNNIQENTNSSDFLNQKKESKSVNSIIITNGDFEDFVFSSSGDCSANTTSNSTSNRAPFQSPDCYPTYGSWWVSHGTPEIYNSGGNNQAVLWTGKWHSSSGDETIFGEGIFIYCPVFKKGNIYNLSLKMKTYKTIDNVKIDLVNDLFGMYTIERNSPTGDYIVGETYKIPEPLEIQNIKQITSFSSSSYVNFEITFIPNKDYSRLWIHPISSNISTDIPLLYIDDVAFNTCIDNKTYDDVGNTLPSQTNTGDFIETVNDVRVTNGQNVTFRATNYIKLSSGFKAENGSQFLAQITNCSLPQNNCSTGNTKKSSISGTVVGKKEKLIDEALLNIYPNPSQTGIFYIDIENNENEKISIKVFDQSGKLLVSDCFSSNSYLFDLSSNPNGIYVIKVESGKNIIIRKVFKN